MNFKIKTVLRDKSHRMTIGSVSLLTIGQSYRMIKRSVQQREPIVNICVPNFLGTPKNIANINRSKERNSHTIMSHFY